METFYEPTEQDLTDYAQHCQEEKTMYSNEEATIYFNEHLDHACMSAAPKHDVSYCLSHLFDSLPFCIA